MEVTSSQNISQTHANHTPLTPLIFPAYNVSSANLYKGCNFYNHPPLGKTCDVNVAEFNPCVRERSFGYSSGTPCVFLKLSRDADWVPQFYNNQSKLPEAMPENLQYDINSLVKSNRRNWVRKFLAVMLIYLATKILCCFVNFTLHEIFSGFKIFIGT